MKLPKLARTDPQMVARIYAAYEAAREEDKPGLRMSSLGDCERNLWAKLHGIPSERPFPGRMLLLFNQGHYVESLLVDDALDLADYEVEKCDPDTGKQFELEALDGQLTGHMDGKIKIAGTWRVLEIKSASLKQFELCQALGYAAWSPKNHAQIQLYMGYSGLEDSVCIVFSKNDAQLYIEKIRFDPEVFKALVEKAQRILEAETVLPRPAEGKSQFCGYCKWCDRNQWCYSATASVSFDE